MRALLDVNVLIALLDQAHPHHETALAWLKINIKHGWASCPITQNGCVRIMSQASYPGARPVSQILDRLSGALNHASHVFWPDDASITDARLFDATRIHGARQVTDAYLLGLAVRHEGRLATFDGGIALASVKGASARHLVTLI
jgi:toxin-antitoxin system PIN domain toxin